MRRTPDLIRGKAQGKKAGRAGFTGQATAIGPKAAAGGNRARNEAQRRTEKGTDAVIVRQ